MSHAFSQNGSFPVSALHPFILRGRAEILPFAPMLEDLAERCGQPGAMHSLDYFLTEAATRSRSPWLVLLVTPGATLSTLNRNSIAGCALFSEYVLFGWGTGAIVPEDPYGFRTVLAPVEYRNQVAERCAAELLNRGAQIVLTSCAGGTSAGEVPMTQVPGLWATRNRSEASHLELHPSYAATLAGFSKPVRRRLVYFRHRLLTKTPCTFVPDVTTELTEAQFLVLNRGCLNVVTDEEAAQRWRACQRPGGFALGLRTNNGVWLGICGGWRQGDTTALHWQQNSTGWETHSLGTVLRSYFLEHETERGMRRVVFIGGTRDSLRHYFQKTQVTDLILRRDTFHARVLLATIARRRNFLADTVSAPDLRWAPTALKSRNQALLIPFTRNVKTGLVERRTSPSRPVAVERRREAVLRVAKR